MVRARLREPNSKTSVKTEVFLCLLLTAAFPVSRFAFVKGASKLWLVLFFLLRHPKCSEESAEIFRLRLKMTKDTPLNDFAK